MLTRTFTLKETSIELVPARESSELYDASFREEWTLDRDTLGYDGLQLVLTAENAVIHQIAVKYEFPFADDDQLFLNGYQSWTLSCERGIREADRSMRFCPGFVDRRFGFSAYGDGTFYKKSFRKGVLHGYSYAYVRNEDRFYFFGSLSEDTGFTRILFDTNRGTVTFEKDCQGRVVNGSYTALDLWFCEGTEQEVFDGWFEALGVTPLTHAKLTGYTSWYNYYQDISEEILLRDVAGMRRMKAKPDLFQIDDGYETAVGDWLSIDAEKFPNGLTPVTEAIREAGLRAGIWLAPFVCEKKSALFAEHPDWLAHDERGNLVYGGCNWSGMYALDFYKEEVRDYIKTCIRTYRELGFTLFKLDFLYAVCLIPRPDKTRGEIMADAMDFLREVCGDAAILGCGVPLASAFGKVEYCRIGMDMSLSWDDAWYMRPFHSERPSTKHTMLNTLYRRQLSGRAFLNDPDVFLLRDDNIRLSQGRKLALAKLNCLLGGVLFTSDNFASYSRRAQQQYLKCLKLRDAKLLSVTKTKRKIIISYQLADRDTIKRIHWS